MVTHLRINLIWVPGHRNIEGNCIADELARQGTTADILRDKDTVGMSMATCTCTHFPTTVRTQCQLSKILDSHGQTTMTNYLSFSSAKDLVGWLGGRRAEGYQPVAGCG